MSYTVRPLGCSAWESDIETLEAARASYDEARALGLRDLVAMDDETGEDVTDEVTS